METPALLAIDDVHLAAPPELAAAVAEFYTNIVGLRLLDPAPEQPSLVLTGASVVKPRLVVSLTAPRPKNLRDNVQVRIAALEPVYQRVQERGLEAYTSQRLSFFDRRLTLSDPAGNRVELLSYHPL